MDLLLATPLFSMEIQDFHWRPPELYGTPQHFHWRKSWGSPLKIFQSPMKIWGSPMQIWGSPTKIWGSPTKIRGSPIKFWGSQTKILGSSLKKVWSPLNLGGLQRYVHGGLQWGDVSKSTPMLMIFFQTPSMDLKRLKFCKLFGIVISHWSWCLCLKSLYYPINRFWLYIYIYI